jgi:hypothetical protein
VANLTTDLAAKATDAAVVHLAGTETITGAKNFTVAPTVPVSSFPESAVTSLTADLAARLVSANNLSDLANAATARTNLNAQANYTSTAVQTANYTATAWQLVPCNATAASFTVTLPTGVGAGVQVAVKLLATTGTNTVTVAAGGADVINVAGTTSAVLQLAAESFELTASGSGTWYLASGQKSLGSLDARYLRSANNLSDLASAATARTSLGLATGATAAIDTTASDIAALGTQAAGATGKLADAGHIHQMPRLDQVAAPTAAVALGTQKITGLANGSAASDGAAFGQIPVAGTGAANYTAGNATVAGDLAGTLPNPTVANINGVAIPANPVATLLSALAGPAVFADAFQGTVGANADTTTNYTSSPGGSSNNFAGATAVFAAAGADGYGRCAKVSIPAGAGAFAFLGTGISPSRSLLYLRQYVQIPTLASSPVPIATLKNGGINGTHLGRIQVSGTGTGSHVQLLDGTDTVAATSALAVVAGAWIRLEWKANTTGSVQTLKIYTGVNLHTTTVTEALSAAMGASNVDYLEHGPTSNPVTPATFSVLYDEVLVLTDGYPGPLLRSWVYSGT